MITAIHCRMGKVASTATMKVARTDPALETIYFGVLTHATNEHLLYRITNSIGNPELEIWLADGVLTARLFFVPGSGKSLPIV